MHQSYLSKKLTIVTDTYKEQINGVSRTILETIKHLHHKGFETNIIEPSMFKTFPCPTYPEIPLSWNIWKVGNMIESSSSDYLHIFTEGPLGIAAKIWADRKGIPYTTSYHTRYPEYASEYFGCGLKFSYKIMQWFHGRAKAIMVNTETMADLLEENGIDNYLVVWSRGVDTDLFKPEGNTPDLFKYLPRPILLNVGRVAIEKNLPAFYNLPGTKIQVGGGPLLEKYRQTYPDVMFVGPKSGEELASYYRAADVFVFPSMTDTYGLVMLESIASGVPVAAYPVTGPLEVLDSLVGVMDNDLNRAVQDALELSNKTLLRDWATQKSWSACTDTFIKYLIPMR